MTSSDTLLVNRILVLVTFSIMVLSIVSCVIMYIFRDYRRKEVASPNSGDRRRQQGELSRQPSIDKDVEPSYQNGSFVRRNGVLSRKNSASVSFAEQSILRSVSDEDTETDPLMPGKAGANSVVETDDESIGKRSLNESIEVALAVGVTLTLHTVKHSRSAKISLANDVLSCRVRKSSGVKVVQIGLEEIKSIISGKGTPNFQQTHLQSIPSELCFSIVTSNKTLDFETLYKTERDALVAGLQILVERYNSIRLDKV